jgi:hypothetical protein
MQLKGVSQAFIIEWKWHLDGKPLAGCRGIHFTLKSTSAKLAVDRELEKYTGRYFEEYFRWIAVNAEERRLRDSMGRILDKTKANRNESSTESTKFGEF